MFAWSSHYRTDGDVVSVGAVGGATYAESASPIDGPTPGPTDRETTVALTEKSRATLFNGLSRIIDEEAVEEMLTNFPSHDVDDIATKDFVRAEIATAKTDIIRWNIATMLVFAGLVIAAIRV